MEGGIFLLLGSNLGNRLQNLSDARNKIGGIVASSSVYMTGAWGNTTQPDFLNQAIQIETQLNPDELLSRLLMIEIEMGRVRIEKWGPRVIDIDILFYNDVIVNTKSLTLPHPEIQNRRFALAPLAEITDLTHPIFEKTIRQLLDECKDTLEVRRLPPQP